MGIGNTTSAAAIVNALFGGDARDWVGPGTGLDSKGVSHKAEIVAKAVSLHGSDDPIEVLRCLGGREIAAMVGAFASARLGLRSGSGHPNCERSGCLPLWNGHVCRGRRVGWLSLDFERYGLIRGVKFCARTTLQNRLERNRH